MASITQQFLVAVSKVSARNAWSNDPRFLTQKRENSQRVLQKNWEGVCCTLPETLTLLQTKICDFSYPISDLIKNLIPNFRPEALEPNEEVANSSKKNINNSRLEYTNHTLFQTKMVEIDTLFQTNTDKKPYPLARHIPI